MCQIENSFHKDPLMIPVLRVDGHKTFYTLVFLFIQLNINHISFRNFNKSLKNSATAEQKEYKQLSTGSLVLFQGGRYLLRI